MSRATAAMMADALNPARGPALEPAYWPARRITGCSLVQSYRNSLHCCETLRQENGKLRAQYCGNRWCLVCASIRTGRAFNNYMPILRTWRCKQFVTLTVQNCSAAQLRNRIAEMIWLLTEIKKMILRRYGITLVGLRKLECTYNAETGEFHPHFHLVLEDEESARLVVAMWLDAWGKEIANEKGQDIRPGNDSLVAEMFKYFTKLVTKKKFIPPPALDVIFRAMKGRRVFQSFGFTLPKEDEESETLEFERGTDAPTRRDEPGVIVWEWMSRIADWVDLDTGECLTGYEPNERFRVFVESIG